MHGQIKITWPEKLCIFYMHYREGLTQEIIALRKGISRSYVAGCISDVWDFMIKEMKRY